MSRHHFRQLTRSHQGTAMLPRMLAMLGNDGSYCVTVVCTAQALVGALVGWWTDFGVCTQKYYPNRHCNDYPA